jgi:hypothetical protein
MLLLVVYLDLFLTLKMEAVLVSFAETSANIYHITPGHILEVSTLSSMFWFQTREYFSSEITWVESCRWRL